MLPLENLRPGGLVRPKIDRGCQPVWPKAFKGQKHGRKGQRQIAYHPKNFG